MATTGKYSPYSSAAPFFAKEDLPAGLNELDAARVQSYFLYERMYWNHPETFKIKQRGANTNSIYLPSAKGIVEARNRFLGRDFDILISPNRGTPDQQITTNAAFQKLFRRELFWTKYAAQKRFGLIWGDTIWHITADPAKPEGSRISLHDVHPSRYFPISAANDDSRVIGCHIIDVVKDPRDAKKTVHRRQTYRRMNPDDPLADTAGQISTELALFEFGKWDDRDPENEVKKIQQLTPPTPLDPRITSIPVYHIRNTWDSGTQFGSSSIRGIETVLNAANQAVSDEDLALAFNGLGMYWTDAPPPRDAAGNPTAWPMGPAKMAEVPAGKQVGRLGGIDNLDSSLNHIRFVLESAQQGAGVPDIAAGKVDVTVAESGIALAMQLAPLIAANEELEGAMLGVYDHMLYDLANMWFPVYEAMTETMECEVTSVVDDPMPVDKDKEIERITALKAAGLISAEEARAMVAKLGIKLDSGGMDQIINEEQRKAANADPFANRFQSELDQFSGAVGSGTVKTPASGETGGVNGTGAVTSSAPTKVGTGGGAPPV